MDCTLMEEGGVRIRLMWGGGGVGVMVSRAAVLGVSGLVGKVMNSVQTS